MKYKINGTLLTFVTALWRCLQPLSKRSTTNGHRRYNGGYFWSERSQKVPEISNKTRMVGSLHKSPGDVSGLRSRPFAFLLAFCCTCVRQHDENLVRLPLFQPMTAQLGNICFIHLIFRFVFGHFWRWSYKNRKILCNLHFERQDGQDGKNGKKIMQLKWPKYQKPKDKNMGWTKHKDVKWHLFCTKKGIGWNMAIFSLK